MNLEMCAGCPRRGPISRKGAELVLGLDYKSANCGGAVVVREDNRAIGTRVGSMPGNMKEATTACGDPDVSGEPTPDQIVYNWDVQGQLVSSYNPTTGLFRYCNSEYSDDATAPQGLPL